MWIYALKKLGRMFLGFGIVIVSFFPTYIAGMFFMNDCNYADWIAVFTNPDTTKLMSVQQDGILIASIALVLVVFIAAMCYGLYLAIGATAMPKTLTNEEVVKLAKEVIQEQCSHDIVHQIGFTNLLKCDECGATLKNPHFIEAEKTEK